MVCLHLSLPSAYHQLITQFISPVTTQKQLNAKQMHQIQYYPRNSKALPLPEERVCLQIPDGQCQPGTIKAKWCTPNPDWYRWTMEEYLVVISNIFSNQKKLIWIHMILIMSRISIFKTVHTVCTTSLTKLSCQKQERNQKTMVIMSPILSIF